MSSISFGLQDNASSYLSVMFCFQCSDFFSSPLHDSSELRHYDFCFYSFSFNYFVNVLGDLDISKMDLSQLEAEAKLAAIKDVKNMLQRPGQLEKVDQYKHRVGRKKASLEAMLKTQFQSQLDGVREGLKQLEGSVSEIKEVDEK